jgi:hypothetical protein
MTERLRDRGERILLLVDDLLDRSTLSKFDLGFGVVFVGPGYTWNKLDVEGQRVQSRLLKELDEYSALLDVLVVLAPSETRKEVEQATKTLDDIADRAGGSWYGSIDDVRNAAGEAIAACLEALESLDDPSDGVPIFVPDTNAVVWSPGVDAWTFANARRFHVILTATFLSELDDLKTLKRSDDVRDTAAAVINTIQDYLRRGDVHAGVTLSANRSTIAMRAAEPDFSRTLPRLDRTVKDDRLIAETIEIIREHPRSPVAIVTADVNLKNKAAAAGIGFVDPPEAGRRERPAQRSVPKARKADIQILGIGSAGGTDRDVGLWVEVQNYGERPARVYFHAFVGDEEVTLDQQYLDVLVNAHPTRVRVSVPRPQFGELVREFGSEPTLYGEELRVEARVDGKRVGEARWREVIYDEELNPERYAIQQRKWRIGRDEATEADVRAEQIARAIEQHDRDLPDRQASLQKSSTRSSECCARVVRPSGPSQEGCDRAGASSSDLQASDRARQRRDRGGDRPRDRAQPRRGPAARSAVRGLRAGEARACGPAMVRPLLGRG